MGFIFETIFHTIKGALFGLLPLLFLLASGVLGVLALLGIVSVKIFLIVLGLFIISFIFMYCMCYLDISENYKDDEENRKKWMKRLLFFNVFIFPIFFAFSIEDF